MLASMCAMALVAVAASSAAAAPAPAPAPEWVAAMKTVHAGFDGTAGYVAQFGDSITYSMAFWKPFSWSDPGCLHPGRRTAQEARRGALARRDQGYPEQRAGTRLLFRVDGNPSAR